MNQDNFGHIGNGEELDFLHACRWDLPRVLVVDDDEIGRILMRESLEQAGFAVAEAQDGVQALRAFEEFRPDIVIMDILMPNMDGVTACRKLRGLEGGDIPILLFTGLSDAESIRAGYDAGATEVLTKPLKWTELEERVRGMLHDCRAAGVGSGQSTGSSFTGEMLH